MTINAHNFNFKDNKKDFKKTLFHEFVHIVQRQNTNLQHHSIQISSAVIRSIGKYGYNHPNTQALLNALNNLKTLGEGHAHYYENKVDKEGKINSPNQDSPSSLPQPNELGLLDTNRQDNAVDSLQLLDLYSIGEEAIIELLNENKHKDPKALLFQELNKDYSAIVKEEIDRAPIDPRAKNHFMHTRYYLSLINLFICNNLKGLIS